MMQSMKFLSEHWTILKDARSITNMPTAYNFKVNLHSKDDKITFNWMLDHINTEYCYKDSFLKALPIRKMKDVIHSNKVRESFGLDPTSQRYFAKPFEVIKKTRVSDLHLKRHTTDFFSDLRFSCSSEIEI